LAAGVEFIDENGGSAEGAATKEAPEEELGPVLEEVADWAVDRPRICKTQSFI